MSELPVKAKAPTRVSFAGGGTDIAPYVSDYGSHVLSAALKLYMRATCGTLERGTSEIELLLSDITRKAIKITSDVVATSGLGGSASAFVAGLKAAFPELERDRLVSLAIFLERKVLRITGGIQDQYCATYGGLLFLTTEGGETEIERMEAPEDFAESLLLIYTGHRTQAGKTTCRQWKLLH